MEKPYHIKYIEEKCTTQKGRSGEKLFFDFLKKYIDRVPKWIDEGLDPNLNNGCSTLLGVAIHCRKLELVKKLLPFVSNDGEVPLTLVEGDEVSDTNGGEVPLTLDITRKCYFCVYERKARFHNTNTCSGIIGTSLSLACEGGYKSLPIIKYLLERGHDPNENKCRAFNTFLLTHVRMRQHARDKNVTVLEHLLDAGIDPGKIINKLFRYGLIECIDMLDKRGLLDNIPRNHPFSETFSTFTDRTADVKREIYNKYSSRFMPLVDSNGVIYSLYGKRSSYSHYIFVLDALNWTLNMQTCNRIMKYMSRTEVLTQDEIASIISRLQFNFDVVQDVANIQLRHVSFSVLDKFVLRGFDIHKLAFGVMYNNSKLIQVIDRYHLDINRVHLHNRPSLFFRTTINSFTLRIAESRDKQMIRDGLIRGADYTSITLSNRDQLKFAKILSKIDGEPLTLRELSIQRMFLSAVRMSDIPDMLLYS